MIFKRGESGFKDALRDLREGYVDAYYPNLAGYAYDAEMIEVSEGRKIMSEILRRIEEIDPDGPSGHPSFRLHGQRNWKSVVDTDDFPVPTDESLEADEGEDDEPVRKPHRHPKTLFNRGQR